MMSRIEYFISMQKALTDSEDFDCWAFKTEEGKYHLAYLSLEGKYGYMADEPIAEEDIKFDPDGETLEFDEPFCVRLGTNTWR